MAPQSHSGTGGGASQTSPPGGHQAPLLLQRKQWPCCPAGASSSKPQAGLPFTVSTQGMEPPRVPSGAVSAQGSSPAPTASRALARPRRMPGQVTLVPHFCASAPVPTAGSALPCLALPSSASVFLPSLLKRAFFWPALPDHPSRLTPLPGSQTHHQLKLASQSIHHAALSPSSWGTAHSACFLGSAGHTQALLWGCFGNGDRLSLLEGEEEGSQGGLSRFIREK